MVDPMPFAPDPLTQPDPDAPLNAASDDAIVAALAQLADAQARLLATEQDPTIATPLPGSFVERNREIEDAHTQVLIAQADSLTARHHDRRHTRTLDARVRAEQAALDRFGFATFADYLHERSGTPSDNAALDAARRAFNEAHSAFERLAHQRSAPPTPGAPGPAGTPPRPVVPRPAIAPLAVPAPAVPAPAAMDSVPGSTMPTRAPDPLASLAVLATTGSGPAPEGDHRARTAILAGAAVVVLIVVGIVALTSRGKPDSTGAGVATAQGAPAPAGDPSRPSRPTNVPPRATATTAAPAKPSTSSVASRTATFCASVKVFAVDDLTALAANGVADPQAMTAALDSFLVSAPAEISDQAKALEPLTRKAIAQIVAGKVTTAQGLQQWLAAAPADELAQWIAAQQVAVPVIEQRCKAA